ncbi:Ff.00g119350.m01.CDS01 [Fusarium sp. VM40]|nr:Ff.00g119350.m01.CDS01 [Fusarium sp. VM40]
MKFLSLITLASFAIATPFRRQQTVTGTLQSSVNTLSNAVTVNVNEINDALDTIQGSVDAQVIIQVQALLRANYQAIAQALNTSTINIIGVTTGAVGGVTGQVVGLTTQQIVQLTATIRRTIATLEQIGATITVTVTDLTPAVRATIQAEINAVTTLINPFITPLLLFSAAVRSAAVTVTVVITGLEAAIASLVQTQHELIDSIGISAIAGF